MWQLLYLVPKNYLSFIVGQLVSIRLPRPFSGWLVRWFANRYKIDLSKAAKDLSEYQTIRELFIRDLKDYRVPEGALLVSPAESKLRNAGEVSSGKLLQVKGIDYSIERLLGSKEVAKEFSNGTYFNFYLSPKDYHQVHSPISGEITGSTYIKGKLWPVNDWSLNAINGLFCVNERLVTYITAQGDLKIALVMVGATNVGRIKVSYDDWDTNNVFKSKQIQSVNERTYQPTKKIAQGDKLGVFYMGSAVVLLLNKKISLEKLEIGKHIELFHHLI